MIDEYVDRLVDHWCEVVPRVTRPWIILLKNSSPGWRIELYFGTLGRSMESAFLSVNTEEKMDRALDEGSEQIDEGLNRLKWMFKRQLVLMARLDAQGHTLRFCGALLLMLMAALGVVATGGGGMGIMAASLCMLWLSMAVESDYAPVCGSIRQTYLVGLLLRTGAIGMMMLHTFSRYAAQGLPSNVVLQSTLLVMLGIHAVLFAVLVLFNARQPLFLRVLAGLTGTVPAMTAAAAEALAAAWLFQPWPMPVSGILGALGALLAFLGEELILMNNLGGIRLKYHSIWVYLLTIGGFMMMLLSVWLAAP